MTDKITVARVFIDLTPLPAVAGLVGALLILAAYAGVQLRRIDPHGAVGLAMNFAGASLVMLSLLPSFTPDSLGALALEAAWAAIALFGLIRLMITRRPPAD